MIPPVIGRMLWYWPNGVTVVRVHNEEKPCAAQIAYVWGERMVNISVIDHNAQQFALTSIPLLQDDDAIPPLGQHYCTWMPYQLGQAAKTEALEQKMGQSGQ